MKHFDCKTTQITTNLKLMLIPLCHWSLKDLKLCVYARFVTYAVQSLNSFARSTYNNNNNNAAPLPSRLLDTVKKFGQAAATGKFRSFILSSKKQK
jgi:hypothetical protein